MDWLMGKSKAKPNGKKPAAAEEKKVYLEPEYAKSRITDFGFKELVVLPREIDLNEWLASNTTTFFHHVNLQYSTISEFCTGEACQTMAVCNTLTPARPGAQMNSQAKGVRRARAPGRAGTGCRREGDMDRSEQGLLRTDPVPEEGEDVAATIGATETLSEDEREELRRELAKVEEEIQTLSQVLAAKEKHLAEIKRKLGINSLQELKQNIAKGWQDVTATSAYKKTSETLSQAGQKASAAFSSVGSVITKKLEDVKNSPTFKSFEEKVENLKSKVGGNKPAGGDFGEVLNSTASASATTTEPLPEQTQESL